MTCNHIEKDITNGRFAVGDRIQRDEGRHGLIRHGTVVRVYSLAGCQFGPYPEMYDVQFDGTTQRGIEHGFLPHGIEREVVENGTKRA